MDITNQGTQALGYIHREVLTVIYVLAAFWPMTYGLRFLQLNSLLSVVWFFSCLVMSVFTLLPAMKSEDIPLMYVRPMPSILGLTF